MSFKNELNSFLTVYNPYSQKYFSAKIKSAAKYAPLISQFYKDFADFCAGGKKLRAYFVYLGYKVAGGRDKKKILPIALALEIVHNFLLIHDDVIDRSNMRRGKPTIHKRFEKVFGEHYGASQAIILGDIVCLLALDLINRADFSFDIKTAVSKTLNKILLETLYGEALDVENSYKRPSLKAIWQVVDLKSARYSTGGPLTIGAILAGASGLQIRELIKFGHLVGMAFQMQDDILGVFGDEKILGKPTISDLREGKNTILIYKTRELAKGQDKRDLERIWGRLNANFKDLVRVRQIMERSGALEWVRAGNLELIEKAKKQVANITKDKDLQIILGQMADFVIEREK